MTSLGIDGPLLRIQQPLCDGPVQLVQLALSLEEQLSVSRQPPRHLQQAHRLQVRERLRLVRGQHHLQHCTMLSLGQPTAIEYHTVCGVEVSGLRLLGSDQVRLRPSNQGYQRSQ